MNDLFKKSSVLDVLPTTATLLGTVAITVSFVPPTVKGWTKLVAAIKKI